MSRLLPRPPPPPPPPQLAHRRAPSKSQQPPDRRLETVTRLEGCIGQVLEATRAYKSPPHHSAHQSANQMFQQRILASQAQMGGLSGQDWLGTMMQCLNESMRTQQMSLARNNSLDAALKAFAAGVFATLGLAYFQEPFQKFMATSSPQAAGLHQIITAHGARGPSGIPSPPRELGPSHVLVQRPNVHHMQQPPSPHTLSSPSALHAPVQPSHPGTLAVRHVQQMHGMPSSYPQPTPQPPPPAPPARQPKRVSDGEPPSAPPRKRAYTPETVRQAAGTMGPPPLPPHAVAARAHFAPQTSSVEFLDIYRENDPRRRQAILGYGGKWYVFQCWKHQNPILFKTAEGAKHHLVTHHTQQDQHFDFIDMVRELGIEVLNCDTPRADMNNRDAVSMWSRLGTKAQPRPILITDDAPAQRAQVPVQAPRTEFVQQKHVAPEPRPTEAKPVMCSPVLLDSPSPVLVADDQVNEITKTDEALATVAVNAETPTSEPPSYLYRSNALCAIANEATRRLQADENKAPSDVAPVNRSPVMETLAEQQKSPVQLCAPTEQKATASAAPQVAEATTADSLVAALETPEMVADSPESSVLSEPPSIEELAAFEVRAVSRDAQLTEGGVLEDGEIDESCIRVASCSPIAMSTSSPGSRSAGKKKRRISGAGAPGKGRKKLPGAPRCPSQKEQARKSLWNPLQDSGPSAHDQFKTRACRLCSERFYFRAQLATHMKDEHPEIVLVA